MLVICENFYYWFLLLFFFIMVKNVIAWYSLEFVANCACGTSIKWSSTWSIFINVLYVFEKNVYSFLLMLMSNLIYLFSKSSISLIISFVCSMYLFSREMFSIFPRDWEFDSFPFCLYICQKNVFILLLNKSLVDEEFLVLY